MALFAGLGPIIGMMVVAGPLSPALLVFLPFIIAVYILGLAPAVLTGVVDHALASRWPDYASVPAAGLVGAVSSMGLAWVMTDPNPIMLRFACAGAIAGLACSALARWLCPPRQQSPAAE
jgi:hypothetical protein